MSRNSVLAWLGVCIGALSVAACGTSSRDPGSRTSAGSSIPFNAVPNPHAHVISPKGFVKDDADDDADDHDSAPSKEDEQEMVLASRHGASPADTREVSSVVRAYLIAAERGDGAAGCSLLTASLSKSLGEARSSGSGNGCQVALSRLFAQQHSHFAVEEPPTLVVTGVHVLRGVGFATLGFRKAAESELLLHREGGRWKVDALSDSILP